MKRVGRNYVGEIVYSAPTTDREALRWLRRDFTGHRSLLHPVGTPLAEPAVETTDLGDSRRRMTMTCSQHGRDWMSVTKHDGGSPGKDHTAQ